MKPAEIPTMTHCMGDVWDDGFVGCGPITIDAAPPPNPCRYCRLQFFDNTGAAVCEFNSAPISGQGRLVIEDALNYVISRPGQELPLAAGLWSWKFQTFTTADHTDPPTTWFYGKINVTKV